MTPSWRRERRDVVGVSSEVGAEGVGERAREVVAESRELAGRETRRTGGREALREIGDGAGAERRRPRATPPGRGRLAARGAEGLLS